MAAAYLIRIHQSLYFVVLTAPVPKAALLASTVAEVGFRFAISCSKDLQGMNVQCGKEAKCFMTWVVQTGVGSIEECCM